MELFFSFFPLSHKIHIRYTFKKTVKVTQNEVGCVLNIHRHVYAVEFLVKVGYCVPLVLKIMYDVMFPSKRCVFGGS